MKTGSREPGDLPSFESSNSLAGDPGEELVVTTIPFSISPSVTPPVETPPADGDDYAIAVCRMCRQHGACKRAGEELVESVFDAASAVGVKVYEVGCLGNCQRGLNAVILAKCGWNYLFGGLTPQDATELVAGVALLKHSSDGQILWDHWPGSLKNGYIARIPSFHQSSRSF